MVAPTNPTEAAALVVDGITFPESEWAASNEVLREAAELIRNYGHLQRAFGDYNCGFCASRALTVAGREVAATPAVQVLARRRFTDAIGTKRIQFWNDHYERTQEEVAAAFDRAAA